jgi:hypothetical protein
VNKYFYFVIHPLVHKIGIPEYNANIKRELTSILFVAIAICNSNLKGIYVWEILVLEI